MMTRTTRAGATLESFRGLVPLNESDFHPAWDHIPRAPFCTQAWHETNKIWPTKITTADFDLAMSGACQTLGPGEGSSMVVLDEGFNVIFGYVCFAETLVELGAPVWYGCRAGYEWLERSGRIPLMDLAVWESTARDRAR